ncbi:MAG TPA: hypothetical protein PKN09_06765 [Novosphingobium sp.]|nr:hypothetical protein [Novosphingobium sp.]
MTSQFIAAAASIAVLGAGFAGVDGVRSAEALPMMSSTVAAEAAGDGNRCRVDVIRSAPSGAADITRQVLNDGSCVCTITTGPSSNNGGAESIVTNLLRDRTCDGAPAPGRPVAEAATAGGGSSVVIPVLVGVVGAAGLAVAVGSDSQG